MWWEDAVVYQVYPRSFQDSDGDGIGDLPGITSRLDHLAWLGADALWLSPIYPSPLADFGYDVSDYCAVDPVFGTLDDFDRLVAEVHARGLKLLMDLVPCHTSIEHPWFREHPERYLWADGRGDGPPNNWVSVFGGSAWSRDESRGRWYLHSFYPEQPDLNWRNPEVGEAIGAAMRFWLDRGVDGFRLDALDHLVKDAELRDDPPTRTPFRLPLPEEYARLEHLYSGNSPDIRDALRALRAAGGDALLVGEVYLPAADTAPYLEFVDAAFAFELFHAPWDAEALVAAIEATLAVEGRAAWILSNHDFRRLPDRYGPENVRVAAMLVCTLPGLAFVYQGDEIGLGDGPGAQPPFDRAGRDAHRHPMQWEPGASGGFTTGTPWLAPVDPEVRSVAAQRDDPGSLLSLYRELLALRPRLGAGLRMLEAPGGMLAYERGDATVLLNTTSAELPAPARGETLLETHPGALRSGRLAAHGGAVIEATACGD